MGGIQVYMKSIDVGVCPSAVIKTDGNRPTANSRTSYDYNGLIGDLLAGETAPNPLPIAAISGVIRPSETVMFEDQALTWARSQPEPRWVGSSKGWVDVVSSPIDTAIHLEGFDICCADGHAKWNKGSIARKGTVYISGSYCLGTGQAVIDADSIYNPYRK